MGPDEAGGKGRLAVVLHGKLGNFPSLLPHAQSRPTRALENAQPSAQLGVLCALSMLRNVVRPNARAFSVDVIGHSWSPAVGGVLDAIYQPVRSLHEPEPSGGCPPALFERRYCERTRAHIRGISRALRLKRSHESSHGFTYDLVFLSRWDVLWQQPLAVKSLPGFSRLANRVWLPRMCAPLNSAEMGRSLRESICGGQAGPWSAPQPALECSAAARACAADMSEEARQYYLMDWWLLFGSSELSDRFAQMDTSFVEIGEIVRSRLSSQQRKVIAMGHAWWGVQLLWRMRAQLVFALDAGVNFILGRRGPAFGPAL
ncbi:MAG: hypothetical protein SGPRY_011304 [Prymnesium sp.]